MKNGTTTSSRNAAISPYSSDIARILLGNIHEHADVPHPLTLLRARHHRPGGRRAAEKRDEIAALHSITAIGEDEHGRGDTCPEKV